MHQLPYFASAIVYNKPLELVFMDIWDPFSKNAMNSSKRCLAFLDDFPKFTWLYVIHNKSQALTRFKKFNFFQKIKLVID